MMRLSKKWKKAMIPAQRNKWLPVDTRYLHCLKQISNLLCICDINIPVLVIIDAVEYKLYEFV